MTYRQYRPNERARQTGTFLGALRYGFAGADSDTIGAKYDSRWDRTASKADRRGERTAAKLLGEVDAARDGVAAAEAKLRCAKGADKPAARRALRDAKDARDRAKRAARKAGLTVLVATLLLAGVACDSDKGLRCTGPAKSQVCTPYDKEK